MNLGWAFCSAARVSCPLANKGGKGSIGVRMLNISRDKHSHFKDIFILKNFLLYMYERFVCMHVCAACVCLVPEAAMIGC